MDEETEAWGGEWVFPGRTAKKQSPRQYTCLLRTHGPVLSPLLSPQPPYKVVLVISLLAR